MRISVRLFASQRETLGSGTLDIEVPDGATAAAAFVSITAAHPQLAALPGSIAFAVNRELASPETPLREGDELALLPPVAGG